jgi:hypothetical protein
MIDNDLLTDSIKSALKVEFLSSSKELFCILEHFTRLQSGGGILMKETGLFRKEISL